MLSKAIKKSVKHELVPSHHNRYEFSNKFQIRTDWAFFKKKTVATELFEETNGNIFNKRLITL